MIPSGRETPLTPAPDPRPVLDPTTASLYETIDAETFSQRSARFNRQETLSFGPLRNLRPPPPQPYELPLTPSAEPESAAEPPPAASADPDLPSADRAPAWWLLLGYGTYK